MRATGYIAGGVEMMGRVAMGSDGAAIAVDPTSRWRPTSCRRASGRHHRHQYGITRDEADAFAVEASSRAKRAWDEGRFARSVVPVTDQNGLTILDRDEYMRPATDMQALGALEPASRPWARSCRASTRSR